MFKGKNLRKFNQYFQNENDCRQYLYSLKWKKGFCCRKCSHTESWRGRTAFHARCKRCNYDESVTAHTVFHNIQFPLLKAFSIVFHHTVYKKGISSRNLAEIVSVNQKTVLSFVRRIRKAMQAYLSVETIKKIDIKFCPLDSIIITRRPEKLNGLQRVSLTIRRPVKSKSCKLHYLGSLSFPNEMDPCHLVAGKFVDENKSIAAWNLKNWITGIHHHCSGKYLQGYLDEFSYKQSHKGSENAIWHNTIKWMMMTNAKELYWNAAIMEHRITQTSPRGAGGEES